MLPKPIPHFTSKEEAKAWCEEMSRNVKEQEKMLLPRLLITIVLSIIGIIAIINI